MINNISALKLTIAAALIGALIGVMLFGTESRSQPPPEKAVISIPAASLSYKDFSRIVEKANMGLFWSYSDDEAAFLTMKRPVDYAGGPAELHILFMPASQMEGVVQFTLWPSAMSAGSAMESLGEILGEPVDIAAGTAFVITYEQVISIPEEAMAGEWINLLIKRAGESSTYDARLLVLGLSMEYEVEQL